LEAAITDALWRCAQAVTGVRFEAAGELPPAAGRILRAAGPPRRAA
jgi:hypothetical protein